MPFTKTLDPIWARMSPNVQLMTISEPFALVSISSPATRTMFCEKLREGPREARGDLMENVGVDALLQGFFSQTR